MQRHLEATAARQRCPLLSGRDTSRPESSPAVRAITDIRAIVAAGLVGFDGNQAALALALGVTRATVSRWMSGQSVPDEGSCLRLARLTGRSAADVFEMAGRDTRVLPIEPELMADGELARLVRRWARRLGELSATDRALVLNVLDDVFTNLCQRLIVREGTRDREELRAQR